MGESVRTRSKIGVAVLLAAGVGTASFWAWRHFTGPSEFDRSLQQDMDAVLADDSRNHGIAVTVRAVDDESVLVYDLKEISGSASAADLFRTFLQFANKARWHEFDSVLLARNGDVRFKIDGAYFSHLGEDYGVENPMYTLRTFPENLRRTDGSRAFSQWEGGVLGVASLQIYNFKH